MLDFALLLLCLSAALGGILFLCIPRAVWRRLNAFCRRPWVRAGLPALLFILTAVILTQLVFFPPPSLGYASNPLNVLSVWWSVTAMRFTNYPILTIPVFAVWTATLIWWIRRPGLLAGTVLGIAFVLAGPTGYLLHFGGIGHP